MNTNDIWLIAGLGNRKQKYDGTRHNAGCAALDYLADKWGISVSKTKFEGLWGQEVDNHRWCCSKPLTYMNLSGDSIAPRRLFQDSCDPRHRSVRRYHPEPRQAAHPALPAPQADVTA